MTPERLPGDNNSNNLPQNVEFQVSSSTLSIVRMVLEQPIAPPNLVAAGKFYNYCKSLNDKLPLSITDSQIPVNLNLSDVNLITAQIGMRKFYTKSREGRRYHTKFRQAIWDLNVSFTNVSGEMTTNFEALLNKHHVIENP